MSISDYVLSASSQVVFLETLELSHPSWSQTYRIVRNAVDGLVAGLEDGGGPAQFDYYPVRIREPAGQANLTMSFSADWGDLGEVLPAELDATRFYGTGYIRPSLVYRAYRSDDLSGPVEGPWRLEIHSVTYSSGSASLVAQTRASSPNRTGLLYLSRLFPTLRTTS